MKNRPIICMITLPLGATQFRFFTPYHWKTRSSQRDEPACYFHKGQIFKEPACYFHNNPALGGHSSKFQDTTYKSYTYLCLPMSKTWGLCIYVYSMGKASYFIPHVFSSTCWLCSLQCLGFQITGSETMIKLFSGHIIKTRQLQFGLPFVFTDRLIFGRDFGQTSWGIRSTLAFSSNDHLYVNHHLVDIFSLLTRAGSMSRTRWLDCRPARLAWPAHQ